MEDKLKMHRQYGKLETGSFVWLLGTPLDLCFEGQTEPPCEDVFLRSQNTVLGFSSESSKGTLVKVVLQLYPWQVSTKRKREDCVVWTVT
ncbi:hypothetical protein Y1Q_0003740 [Alligator mississippiensis]|uniref:Uncharacterized protein n=1 Tax=Alligator mississippiensis TaxID=8496 RepID=A0A151MNF2_ALLMI|nr:hypothetical protein Y1Q_0003740 [Alligator mississippiensis]